VIQLVAAAVAFATLATAYPGEKQFGAQTKISIAQARTIAVRTYPGKIVGEELEKEKGGSGLRYSFDIKHGSMTREIGVDALTGKVLENAVETGTD
jgi:uncharacterized membrane protein YkoI